MASLRLFFLLLVTAVLSLPQVHSSTEISAEALLQKMDQLYQQDNAKSIMTMEVVTPDFERTIKLESWSLGLDYALVRILEPRRERGVSTLKRESEMWNYLPKIRKVVKVPPSMMMDSWMGSDFTNDDLMREGSWVEEFDVDLNQIDDLYVLDLVAKPDTVTVWGRMQIEVDVQTLLPVKQVYFDENNTPMREMIFSGTTSFGSVTIPAVLELRSLNKPGNLTRVVYEEMQFDLDIDESFFSLQSMKSLR